MKFPRSLHFLGGVSNLLPVHFFIFHVLQISCDFILTSENDSVQTNEQSFSDFAWSNRGGPCIPTLFID